MWAGARSSPYPSGYGKSSAVRGRSVVERAGPDTLAPATSTAAEARCAAVVLRCIMAWSMRIVAALLLALVACQATGVLEFGDAVVCAEGCADDDAEGNCASDCDDCACCGHAGSMLPATAGHEKAVFSIGAIAPWFLIASPPSISLPGIDHVPKRTLA